MKKEYDFSTAQRGKFFNKSVNLNMPVYLNRENLSFVGRLARQRKTDMSSMVNELIKVDMRLAQAIQ
jgi:hypothetical protein